MSTGLPCLGSSQKSTPASCWSACRASTCWAVLGLEGWLGVGGAPGSHQLVTRVVHMAEGTRHKAGKGENLCTVGL